MTEKNVKNLRWISVFDWLALPNNHFSFQFSESVDMMELNSFTETLFMEIEKQLNIPYTDISPIIKEKNMAFFKAQDKLFSIYSSLGRKTAQLNSLIQLLKIPVDPSVLTIITPKIQPAFKFATI